MATNGPILTSTDPSVNEDFPRVTGTTPSGSTSKHALDVALLDANGDQVTSFGGGTQYTEGDTDATVTGTAVMWEDTSDTLRAVSAAKPLPVNVVSGGTSGTEYTEDAASVADPVGGQVMARRRDSLSTETTTDGDVTALNSTAKGELYVKHVDAIPITDNGGSVTVDAASLPLPTGASTAANQSTIIGHVDGIEALLTTIDADTSTIAGAVSGTEMQVDVVSSALPTGAATSANQTTIIGHLDGVEGLLTTIDADTSTLAGAVSGSEMQVDVVTSALPTGAATAANQTTLIGHVDGIETLLGTIDADTGNIATSTATIAGAVSGSEMQVDVITMPAQTATTTTAGTPAGVTVSTSAVLLKASNASRKSIVITNNGTGDLFIGHTSGVTTTGATIGLIVPSKGSYSDSGFGLYTGDLYGIYSAAAASQNVSVSERT